MSCPQVCLTNNHMYRMFLMHDAHNFFFKIEYAGRLYDIEIVDTAGQEEFSSFRDSSLATGDAFLILFAINSQASWLEMKELRSKIIEDKEQPSIPMVIVGNKRVSSFLV